LKRSRRGCQEIPKEEQEMLAGGTEEQERLEGDMNLNRSRRG
jgi:hypothetical protein